MNIQQYASDLINDLRTDAMISGTDTADEFYHQALDILEDNGEFDSPNLFYFGKNGKRNRLMQIDGYCFDETDKSIVLFIFDFEDSISPGTITNSQIDLLYKRMFNFLDEVVNGNLSEYCDASDDVLKLEKLIKSRLALNEVSSDYILKIKFYIITNKYLSSRVKKIKQEAFENRPVEINLWHLERFYELSQQSSNEPILIDFPNQFNSMGIPCIKGNVGENLGYTAYIAIIPGKLLADIYIEYGSKVLEGNVRAFLGTSGSKSVNNGIKRTIINEPTRFFTYNNGIAATAADIKLDIIDGQYYITQVKDLQIINGGQTTATLAEAVLKKNNPTLDGIFVPMKLTVINDRDSVEEDGIRFYDAMVERIARYANSQNKVTAADFFSNSPYHIAMEQMSKRYFAPPVNGNPNPTGWYYERTKKKYNQEQLKMTKAEKDRFAAKFPKKQIIKKEQLGKYLYAVEGRPDIVSRGNNWVIKDFGTKINEDYAQNRDQYNEFYFKKCVAAAIFYRTVDSYLEQLKKIPGAWYQKGGYKLNIVPYTVSKICDSIPKGYSIDWMDIWKNQRVSNELMHEIEIVTKMTNDFICDSHGMIVTEYCKRKETWEQFRKIPYTITKAFLRTLVKTDYQEAEKYSAKKEQKEENELKDAVWIAQKGADYWKMLVSEGYNAKLLELKEMQILKVAVDIETTGKLPTAKQTKAILKIKKKLEDQGIVVKE